MTMRRTDKKLQDALPARIKAVSFDLGDTLVSYGKPLNWKSLYIPALKSVTEKCKFVDIDNKYILDP